MLHHPPGVCTKQTNPARTQHSSLRTFLSCYARSSVRLSVRISPDRFLSRQVTRGNHVRARDDVTLAVHVSLVSDIRISPCSREREGERTFILPSAAPSRVHFARVRAPRAIEPSPFSAGGNRRRVREALSAHRRRRQRQQQQQQTANKVHGPARTLRTDERAPTWPRGEGTSSPWASLWVSLERTAQWLSFRARRLRSSRTVDTTRGRFITRSAGTHLVDGGSGSRRSARATTRRP